MATQSAMKLRILFVDDEPHLREFMKAELPRLGQLARCGQPMLLRFS